MDQLFIQKISVYETYNGGGVKLVQLLSPEQKWMTVFKMESTTPKVYKNSRIFDIFPKVSTFLIIY